MTVKRKIVKIDEEKCDGCGLCVPACAEGAIRIVDGKARLISEVFCDGLGACLGECPRGAIAIEERKAEQFDEQAVKNHLARLDKEKPKPPAGPQGAAAPFQGCPGALSRMLRTPKPDTASQPGAAASQSGPAAESQLANWPIQMNLVPVQAPYFQGAKVLIAADCVPFALADFHSRFLAGRVLLVGCPKLDDAPHYREKLAAIFAGNEIDAVEVLFMQVPCCFGLVQIAKFALEDARKAIPLKLVKIGLRGDVLEEIDPSSSGGGPQAETKEAAKPCV